MANLISVPLQYNYDDKSGRIRKDRLTGMNIQPVIPFGMNKQWNFITRSIVPLVNQEDIPVTEQGESWLGNIVASQFFSPKALPPPEKTAN